MDATLAKKLQLKPGQALRTHHAPKDLETVLPASGGDGVVDAPAPATLSWVAYPKADRLGTDLDRDSLAAFVTARGVRPVRQVAIDDTWSALRFRPAAR